MTVKIIGAGLAGSEAAWQIAESDIKVEIFEMRPSKLTKAHKTGKSAELVCSNSFRGSDLSNAVGLLKEELRCLNSLIMQAAEVAKVPAGGALAVDREVFSSYVDNKLKNHPNITFTETEITEIPESSAQSPVIVATGPLTSKALAASIQEFTGEEQLSFFDAISPIVFYESLDTSKMYRKSRYDKGTADYFNIPFTKEQYYQFINDVKSAEKFGGHEEVESDSIENLRPFEGCMPIEDMIERGPETLRFGPFKPVGLREPNTGETPYAVMQLRADNKEETLWSLVGMQTRMKHGEQLRIFKSLPGMERAEFVRLGSVHRNSFINSPNCLERTLQFKNISGLFFAGQITGVEGYVESTAGGLLTGKNAVRLLRKESLIDLPANTAIGALVSYISDPERKDFQPMNVSFGLMQSYHETPNRDSNGKKIPKKLRREKVAKESLARINKLWHLE